MTVIEMEPPDVFTRLDRGELDVVVAVDFRKAPPRSDPHYHRVELMSDVLDAMLPADHPLAHQTSIDLVDLASDIFVTASPGTSCSEVTLATCAAAGFSPDVRNYSTEWGAVAALVSVGAGVGLLPRLAQPLHCPGVVVRPLRRPKAARNIFAAVRAGAQDDPVLAATLAALCDVAAAVSSSPAANNPSSTA